MDQPAEPFSLPDDSGNADQDSAIHYPPKFERPSQSPNVWLKSVLSLAAYLVVGYYIFPNYRILLLITAITILHELGHFLAMKFFRYKDLGIFFIPLLAAYVSGSKREISQRESAVILLAGPLPGILIGAGFYFLSNQYPNGAISGLSYYTISLSFILLNLVNLLPIYPLDGGQLLNRVFLDEESIASKLFVLLSIGALIWLATQIGQKPASYLLLLFPLMMLYRMFGNSPTRTLEKKIQESGIDMDKSYEELSDEDYWRIRQLLIQEHPSFKDIPAAPPFEFSDREDRIMLTIQQLLHRHLIQDMSVVGKIIILLLCATAFATPWFLGMYQLILARLGY